MGNPTTLAGILTGPLVEIIDSLFTTEEEKAAAKLKLLSLEMQPYLAQLEVNKIEAANANVFVSGWRPFIGWTCGGIFGWNYIVAPFLQWIALMFNSDLPPMPVMGMEVIMPVLLGLLGLGGMRTFEKFKNVEANR